MKKINVIGAFDRYNFGDVLLPIIFAERMKKYKNCSLDFYALKEANLEYCGGLKTKSLSALQHKNNKNDIFCIVGGDVIGADIGTMYLHLSKNKIKTFIFKCIRKVLGSNRFNNLCQIITKYESIFPWVINREIYGKNIKIIYNAVGATNSCNISSQNQKSKLLSDLNMADYISVREDLSFKLIEPVNSKIYPDSAICMSEYFKPDRLNNNTNRNILKFINSNKNKYIVIQVNREYLKNKNIKLIRNEFLKVLNKGYKIVLLPIGFAELHEDLYSLKKIKRKIISENIILFEKVNIFEIMNIISNAYIFLGTSLHGNITAISYCVRHFAISKKMKKLINFNKLWDIDAQKCVFELDNFSKCLDIAEKITDNDLIKNKDKLIKLANENFDNIIKIIESE